MHTKSCNYRINMATLAQVRQNTKKHISAQLRVVSFPDNFCISCGTPIPEGEMLCRECQLSVED